MDFQSLVTDVSQKSTSHSQGSSQSFQNLVDTLNPTQTSPQKNTPAVASQFPLKTIEHTSGKPEPLFDIQDAVEKYNGGTVTITDAQGKVINLEAELHAALQEQFGPSKAPAPFEKNKKDTQPAQNTETVAPSSSVEHTHSPEETTNKLQETLDLYDLVEKATAHFEYQFRSEHTTELAELKLLASQGRVLSKELVGLTMKKTELDAEYRQKQQELDSEILAKQDALDTTVSAHSALKNKLETKASSLRKKLQSLQDILS